MQHFGRWLRNARATEWRAVGRRLTPVALVGAVLGYLVWPARVDSYSKFWMPLLGAAIALNIRSIIMQVVRRTRLLLDEPGAGLDTAESQKLGALAARLRSFAVGMIAGVGMFEGLAVHLVSQRLVRTSCSAGSRPWCRSWRSCSSWSCSVAASPIAA